MRHGLALVCLLVFFISFTPASMRETDEIITILPATYQFGQNIHFQASIPTSKRIEYAVVYFSEIGSERSNYEPATISTEDGQAYQIDYLLDLNEKPLRAFSRVEYHFEIGFTDNQVITSPTGYIDYVDDRFDWQTIQAEPFFIYWYDGDLPYILDVAQTGLENIETLLPITRADPIRIYIYASTDDMQETLLLSHSDWLAGHTDPDLGVIIITLPPGPEQQLLAEQRIPHELMHVLLYRSLGEHYTNLPTWLNEGLASLSELIPNSDYEVLLDSSFEKGKLLPMTYLCQNFPREASGTLLAYAQSASFVSNLRARYGTEGLQKLIDQYASGVDCENGARNALGVSLTQLEQKWRQTRFGEDVNRIALQNSLPWIAVLVAVFAAPTALIIAWMRRRPAKSNQAPLKK